MQLNWINAENYNMETFLLLDDWMLKLIMTENMDYHLGSGDYISDMAKALSRYPSVLRYCEVCVPECRSFFSKLHSISTEHVTDQEARGAELAILQSLEVFVVYAWPAVMDQLNYIQCWSPQNLYSLVDLDQKTVLDVGSGTGRLAFAAAEKARQVYAVEPGCRLRSYMKKKILQEEILNVRVTDGTVLSLPFEDNTFDVVMAGHVIGDHFHAEMAELTRVLKNGGWLVSCSGDDEFKRTGPSQKFVNAGFEFFCHTSSEGGIIYDYRKQIFK